LAKYLLVNSLFFSLLNLHIIMDPFIGQICLFGFDFAPRGWMACNGQLLPIAQNSALFSLLGTTYGGDGRTTFALPDLRGRVPVHQGQGAGRSVYTMGEAGGAEQVTLTVNQMPAHTHPVRVPISDGGADQTSSQGNVLASDTSGSIYTAAANANDGYPGVTAQPAGGNQPVSMLPPFLVGNYCIAIQGIFPSRN
jgi:microcystin-dependent protein